MSSADTHQANGVDPIGAVAHALRAQQGQVEYLCEVPLPDGVDLASLLKTLRRQRGWGIGRDAQLALARAAVEVCFEHEDSGGLVVPFMRQLGIADEDACKREWAEHVGPAVRGAIEQWAGFAPEFRWRYVGPVRVHTGVPRLLIPRFARLVFDIACDHGLEAVASLPSETLQRAVNTAFQGTRFASEFLSSEAGEELVRAAGAVLARSGWPARRDVAGRLAQEPGFHTGFLHRLVQELNPLLDGEGRKPKHGIPRGLWPVLIVLEEQGRMAVRFPGLAASRTCKYTWNQSSSHAGSIKSVMYLGKSVRYESMFTGTVEQRETEGEWSIQAWPRRNSAWAVFDLRGAIAGSHGQTTSLPAGEYLIAVSDCLAATALRATGLEIRADLGLLEFDGADVGDFALLHVALVEGCDALPGVSVVSAASVPRFEVESAHPLDGCTPDVDVVLSPDAAHIRVAGWTAERFAHFRVTREVEGHVDDVTQQLHPSAGSHRLLLPQRPHVGVVRIEGRGRRSGSLKSESTLVYAVWPDVQLLKSPNVMGANDIGTVTIRTSAVLDVLDQRGQSLPRVIEVAPPSDEASLVLRIGHDELRVTSCLPRARMVVPGEPGTPVLLDMSAIDTRDRASSSGRLGDFTIVAARRKGWKLTLRTANGTYPLFEVSDFAAEKSEIGRYPLRWAQIRDAVRGAQAEVGLFELTQYGRQLPLEVVLVNTAALWRPRPTLEAPTGTPPELVAALNGLRGLQAGHQPSDSGLAAPLDSLQNIIDPWLRGARIVYGIERHLDGNARQLATLVRRSRERLRPSDASALVDEWRRLDAEAVLALTGVRHEVWPTTWRVLLSEAEQRLMTAADSTSTMRQLRRAVLERTPPPSDVPDGLLNGLRNYRIAFSTGGLDVRQVAVQSALHQLRAAWMAATDLWCEVARAFYLLTMLRSGNITPFLNETSRLDPHSAIPPCLSYVLANLRGGAVASPVIECSWALADVSPLDDDTALAALARCDPNVGMHAGSWLTLWLLWRAIALGTNGEASNMLLRARARMHEIPGTMQDRDKIVSELELGKLVKWE
ncbi:MAG: hypothetical protein IT430_20520 [Phycisphaerales bacterium]|nr:hypothetical protein [Phycisphaerales bacterium]